MSAGWETYRGGWCFGIAFVNGRYQPRQVRIGIGPGGWWIKWK